MLIDFASRETRIALAQCIRRLSLQTGESTLAIIMEAVTKAPASSSLVGNFRRGGLRQLAYVEVLRWLKREHPAVAAEFVKAHLPTSRSSQNADLQAEQQRSIARTEELTFELTGTEVASFFYGPVWRRQEAKIATLQKSVEGIRGTIRVVGNDLQRSTSFRAYLHLLRCVPGKPYMVAHEYAIKHARRGERTDELLGVRSGWAYPLSDGTIHRLLINGESPEERTFDVLSEPLTGDRVPEFLSPFALDEVREIRRSFINLNTQTFEDMTSYLPSATSAEENGQPYLIDYAVLSSGSDWLVEEAKRAESIAFRLVL